MGLAKSYLGIDIHAAIDAPQAKDEILVDENVIISADRPTEKYKGLVSGDISKSL